MEGWALYPSQFKEKNDNVFSVWLIADSNLLKNRIIANRDFYMNAKEPEKVIGNYLYRSEWHNQTILEQCRAGSHNYILVKEESTTEETVSSVLDMLNRI